MRELNEQRDSKEWIDLVVVLGKGNLSYAVQMPFGKDLPGGFGGPTEDSFAIVPIYVHLTKSEDADLALNHFFLRLMSHLAFFRKRTTLDFEGVLGPDRKKVMTIQGYQYNLQRRLVPVEESHQAEHFRNPQIRFNLYSKKDRTLLGQVCLWPWQDGAVITCSVRFDHRDVFQHYFRMLKHNGLIMKSGADFNLWLSSVLPVSEADFISASANIHPDIISVRDPNTTDPPPVRLPE
jgi:hypothetical protein